jgi:fatty-acyl-CoA synthase
VLDCRAESHADLIAYDFEGDRLTCAALHRDALDRARGLMALGLEPRGRCALILPTGLELIRLIYGVQLCGAAPVILDPAAPPSLLTRRIRQCRPTLVVGLEDVLDTSISDPGEAAGPVRFITPEELPEGKPDALLPEARPDDIAYLQFTSGTTGEPKIAVILHRNLLAYLSRHSEQVPFRSDDVFLSWVPLHHDLGLVGYAFRPLYLGCPSYLLPPTIASIRNWLRKVSEVGATITSGPDFGYRYATRSTSPDGLDLSRLRMAASGGEVVRIDTIREFETRFDCRGVSVGGYGQAESVMCISIGRPDEALRVDDSGHVANGRPLPGLEVKIIDDGGESLPPDQVGEITVRGSSIFVGYFEDEKATRETLKDGWLHTGDIGYLDTDGYLFILGRAKTLIKRGGSIICPREVETAAEQIPEVQLAAAIGVPRSSALGGEDLVVIAEVSAEKLEDAQCHPRIAEAVATAVAGEVGHSPADVVLVAPRSIPRTRNGKLRHELLRARYSADRSADQQINPLT